jgi:hypothetical protein
MSRWPDDYWQTIHFGLLPRFHAGKGRHDIQSLGGPFLTFTTALCDQQYVGEVWIDSKAVSPLWE